MVRGRRATITVFCALTALFAVLVGIMVFVGFRKVGGLPFMIASGASLLLLGVALIVLTRRHIVAGPLRKFLLLTGASVAIFLPSILLHNLVYGLLIHFFGPDFWGPAGSGDEAVFFIIAIFVCPIGFLVGVVGSVVLLVKEKRRQGSIDSTQRL